ncbi:MAG: methyltransferase domain-containing protein [Candidatus Sumerlaeaceae bacterium]|nr:methyltransferase domain-containing protein [Candidatus Sumerlaeaceae bacterium]
MNGPHAAEDDTRKFFDRCADHGEMAAFLPEHEPKVARFMAAWNIRPGTRVLEPGCGSGRLTERLAAAVGPAGLVVACDPAPGMIRAARARNLPPQVRLVESTVIALEEPAESFDIVVCFCVFPHLAPHPQSVAAMARLLRPGGDLWINHLEGREQLNAFHRQAAPEVAGHMLPSEQAMRLMLAAAGLSWLSLTDTPDEYALHARKPATHPGR